MDAEIEPEIAEYPEAGPFWVGLWAVAQHWVAILANVFEPEVLAGPGITRRFAVRCCNWLWPIEGMIRRLIIAAAMKLDIAQLPSLMSGKPKPSKPRKTPPSVAFAVLPRLPGRQPRTAPHAGKPPSEHRHLIFPGDALLQLFPRHDKRNARPLHRSNPNPLHRRGRVSRWDPDYQGQAKDVRREGDVVYTSFMLHGRNLPSLEGRARPEPHPRTRADRSSPHWRPPGGDLPEWKRLEQEWERIVPAPRLAGRIKALIRVMQAPERWIARAARRLSADLIARLRTAPAPKLKKPKLDRTPSGFLAEPLAQAHALIDTS